MKTKIRALLPLLIMILMLISPQKVAEGAEKALSVWVNVLIPTLFPFSVAASFLIRIDALSGAVGNAAMPVLAGAISGYPVGAAMTNELFASGKINKKDAEKLFILSAFASPLFMLRTAGGLIGGQAGIVIIVSQYIAEAVMYFIILKKDGGFSASVEKTVPKRNGTGRMLSESVRAGINGILNVGGYLVIFSVITSFLPEHIRPFASVFLEMSGGVYSVALMPLSFQIKTALSAFSVTWGGLCIIMQITSYSEECNVSAAKVIFGRLFAGVIAFISAYLISFFFV